jgi:hypothetical protein
MDARHTAQGIITLTFYSGILKSINPTYRQAGAKGAKFLRKAGKAFTDFSLCNSPA